MSPSQTIPTSTGSLVMAPVDFFKIIDPIRIRFHRRSLLSFTGLLLALFAWMMTTLSSQAQSAPTLSYTWNITAEAANSKFTKTLVDNGDGTTGGIFTVVPSYTGADYNEFFLHNVITGGHQYTAVMTYNIQTPTTAPNTFYFLARVLVGGHAVIPNDIWQNFSGPAGAAGTTRTISFPVDLPVVAGGTWQLHIGLSRGGSILVKSLKVYNGLTSDGVQPYAYDRPTLNAVPTSTRPAGVTEATGCPAFTITAPTTSGTIRPVALTAYVAGQADSVASTNASLLLTAINACGAGDTLQLSPGTYRLKPSAPFAIGKTNFTFDGLGAVLLMATQITSANSQVFSISGSSKVVFKNLMIDWDANVKPIASLATVSNLTSYACDLTFPASYTAAQMAVIQAPTTQWKSIVGMDTSTLVINSTVNFKPAANPTFSAVANPPNPNMLHVTFGTTAGTLPVLSTYCIRFLYYEYGVFKINDSNNISFNNVQIYSIPGMGWLFEGHTHHLQMLNCKIIRGPGEAANPFTTAADGIHGNGSQGYIDIEGCFFTGMGDDGINIHDDVYAYNVAVTGANTIRLYNCNSYQLRLTVGDPLEFYNPDYSYLGTSSTPVTATVVSFTTHDGSGTSGYEDVVLSAVPAGLSTDSQAIIRNATFNTTNVRILTNNFRYMSARSILLSADNATVGSNFFQNVWCAPLIIETDIVTGLWAEGKGASNILIKQNTFWDSNQMGRYGGAYIYANPGLPWGPTNVTLFDQISIEANVFNNCGGPAVSLHNCQNVLINTNQFRLNSTPVNLTADAATIKLFNCSDVASGGNWWRNSISTTSLYGVIYDPATVFNINPDLNEVSSN